MIKRFILSLCILATFGVAAAAAADGGFPIPVPGCPHDCPRYPTPPPPHAVP